MECPKNGDSAALIIAYTAGTLDAGNAAAFERHLESCANCRQMALEQRVVWSALDELPPVQVSSNFDAKLYKRIAEEQQMAWWLRWFRAEWPWRPAMPVAAVCMALIVAFLLKNSGAVVAPPEQTQPKLQIEQVERALDDMEMLKQAGVEFTLEKTAPREQI
jgi:anti-sigma factor RsiW